MPIRANLDPQFCFCFPYHCRLFLAFMNELLTGCIVCGRVPGEHRGQESIMHRSHQHHTELVGGVQLLATSKGKPTNRLISNFYLEAKR